MQMPKTRRRYCPKCKKHTEHKVSQAKRKAVNATHHQTHGSRARQRGRDRGVGIGMGNKGRFSRKAISQFKMTGKKLTKKTDFRFTCSECNRTVTQQAGVRTKKVEMQ